MSKREDIIGGSEAHDRLYGLIYTERCGWVDLGHANPAGARELWRKIKNEKSMGPAPDGYFLIRYNQMMGRPYFKVGTYRSFYIKKGLSLNDKKSVALSVFLEVSHAFESMQADWFWSRFTNSGFSEEDLVSDLIGFYRAVNQGPQYISLCKPVSKSTALQLWDKYGPVGNNKNHVPVPYIYPLPPSEGKPKHVPLPQVLRSIRPAKKGIFYRDAK